MSLDYKIEAIQIWPGEKTPSWRRTRSPFKTIWTKVINHLDREIRMLGGRNVVFRLEVSDRDIRQDGLLRSDARPREPGVVVQFTAGRLKGSPTLFYRCDRFPYWQDNISAIARGLEALRMVDRYGVTPTGEQYAGFKALPASTQPTLSVQDAAKILGNFSAWAAHSIIGSAAETKEAIRVARNRTHPDKNGGDRTMYDQVEMARSILSSHHGVSL